MQFWPYMQNINRKPNLNEIILALQKKRKKWIVLMYRYIKLIFVKKNIDFDRNIKKISKLRINLISQYFPPSWEI
jgi:hypothetical protein